MWANDHAFIIIASLSLIASECVLAPNKEKAPPSVNAQIENSRTLGTVCLPALEVRSESKRMKGLREVKTTLNAMAKFPCLGPATRELELQYGT